MEGQYTGNIDDRSVKSFGAEWTRYHRFEEKEIERIGATYFDLVTPDMLGPDKHVVDIGCGSGRWSKFIHDKVGTVVAIDPSESVLVAREILKDAPNVKVIRSSIDDIPYPDASFDFAFSLGVLHHIPDTQLALDRSVSKLKPGGYFLLYIYYNLDNRGVFYKSLFSLADFLRRGISRLPGRLKRLTCDILALLIYMPFVWLGRILKWVGVSSGIRSRIPLHIYEGASFYVIRNDALDRFGTPLEKRFSRQEIQTMMENAGLTGIRFSDHPPYWHAIGQRK